MHTEVECSNYLFCEHPSAASTTRIQHTHTAMSETFPLQPEIHIILFCTATESFADVCHVVHPFVSIFLILVVARYLFVQLFVVFSTGPACSLRALRA